MLLFYQIYLIYFYIFVVKLSDTYLCYYVIVILLLSGVLHYQCFDGHGVPLVSVFRCSYHFCFFYFHPNTEALCIGNSLSSSATLSLNFSTYAKVFYFFISHSMSKEAHLSPSYSNYQIPFC